MEWTPELEKETDRYSIKEAEVQAKNKSISDKFLKGTIAAKFWLIIAVGAVLVWIRFIFDPGIENKLNTLVLLVLAISCYSFFDKNEQKKLAREIYLKRKKEILERGTK